MSTRCNDNYVRLMCCCAVKNVSTHYVGYIDRPVRGYTVS